MLALLRAHDENLMWGLWAFPPPPFHFGMFFFEHICMLFLTSSLWNDDRDFFLMEGKILVNNQKIKAEQAAKGEKV